MYEKLVKEKERLQKDETIAKFDELSIKERKVEEE